MGCSSPDRGRLETAKCRVYTTAQRLMSLRGMASTIRRVVDDDAGSGGLIVTCVYRRRNSAVVLDLIRPVYERADIRLWALDDECAELAQWTVGKGPGSRLQLHEDLLSNSKVRPTSTWLVIDDDVRLVEGSLLSLAQIAQRAALDVFGPTHVAASNFNHLITIQRPALIARDTSFVEIGPVIGFSPAAREKLLPFADPGGLSWGMEAVWARARDDGLRLGLIDALPIEHLGVVGADYEKKPEEERTRGMLETLGYRTLFDLFKVHGRWWSFQSRPPWVSQEP